MDQEAQTGVQEGAADQGKQQQTGQQGQTPDIPDDLQGFAVKNDKGEVLIPLRSVLDERGKRRDFEGRLKKAEDQLLLYRMNPAMGSGGQQKQSDQQKAEPAKSQVTLPDILSKMDDDEMINAGELKQALKGIAISGGQQAANPLADEKTFEMIGENLLFSIKDDAEHVLMGGFRQRLQAEPYLLQWVQNAHPMLRPFLAYRLGLGQTKEEAKAGSEKDVKQGKTGKVDQIVKNIDKPTPTSLVAGSGAFNAADRFMKMSDADFEAEIERVKQGG